MRRRLPCIALILALGACSSDQVNYPSLARRDAERIATSPAPAPSPVAAATPAPPSPELLARLSALVTKARAAHDSFMAKRPRAEQLADAASGAPVASEAWSVATVALAELESARSDGMIALADLDQLYTAERIAGSSAAEIASARDQVTALVGDEDRVLASLRAMIR
ncbi:MAG: hypothetical protein KGL44_13475 [Sphingomonadales bacterium]|nr:hypothetical protein [Sphingomonadales bacterium]